ncbi:MAG: queuosine salvage family protein [bacterium]|nr:queuosine salvage family protein [bacterium]
MNPFVRSLDPVLKNPKHCFVGEAALEVLAQDLAKKKFKTPAWRESCFPESDDQVIEFFGVANAINFGFTDFKTGKQFDVEYPKGSGKIWKGSFAMVASLKRALDENFPILHPYTLSQFSPNFAERIFRHHTTPIPMLNERVKNLQNIGRTFGFKKIWSFTDLFKDSDFYLFNNGKGILEKLTNFFDCYKDISLWNGHTLQFHKRAQLFAMAYHGRALSSNGKLQPIRDPENFGPISDYRIPQVLRYFGLLCYRKELARKIEKGVLIPKDSDMEIEIRAQAVNIMHKLLLRINALRKGSPITMTELDYFIWSTGKKKSGSFGRHHFTYTTSY